MCWGSEAGARLGSADTKAALSAVSPEIVTSGWEVVQNKVAPLSPLLTLRIPLPYQRSPR